MATEDASLPPLLFLDVDGPLIPFGGPVPHRQVGPGEGAAAAHPLLARLDPTLGARLAGLDYELLWATTWGEDANAYVAPRIGLPPLPVLPWPEPSETEERDVRAGRHWKTRPIVARATGRPFAWVDDEITHADRLWVAAHHDGPALLHRVDPRLGLTADDIGALRSWAAELKARH
ncbi:HAD domain-containing protein [Streptacidiphilus rugosus]|uniref:HAD domain-containing protein n=1 Tax=Streptacidiphilus rugosus TaxID=405783 RepID=UPI0005619212|nr:HAD domain-containing protein [Streptacidiphilus rugosus]